MKKYILSALMIFAASASFAQSSTIQETQFANAPQQWDNQMITIQNVEISFEEVPPHMKNNQCKAPRSFDVINIDFKGARPDFKPCFLISHQMKIMNAQKVGGRKGKYDLTFKGNQASGYVISVLTPKGI
jgi:hypothetical protein